MTNDTTPEGDFTSRMLDQWVEHREGKPDLPEDPTDWQTRQMNRWQAEDDAYRLLVGTWLASEALLRRREAGND